MPNTVTDGFLLEAVGNMRRFSFLVGIRSRDFTEFNLISACLVEFRLQRAVPVFFEKRRTCLRITCAAISAGMVTAIFRDFFLQGAFSFFEQKFFAYSRFQVVPRKRGGNIPFSCPFLNINIAFFGCFIPWFKAETLNPCGKDCALLVCAFDKRGKPPVTAGNNAFKVAHGRFVPTHDKGFLFFELVTQIKNAVFHFFQ